MAVKITENSILIKKVVDEFTKIIKDNEKEFPEIVICAEKDEIRIFNYSFKEGVIYFTIKDDKICSSQMISSSNFELIKPILEKSKFNWEIDLY